MSDDTPPDSGRDEHHPRDWPADITMALRFFSRLPSGGRPHERPDLERMAPVLPIASLAIGALPALALLIGSLTNLPKWFVAALAVAVALIAAGAMAEDAIADAADGLFGGSSRERRLEIMKDSRHGTYGVAALCLFLLLRIAAIATMTASDAILGAGLWLSAMVMARSGALWLAVALPPARADGASAAAGQLTLGNFALGAVVAAILGLMLAAPAAGIPGFVCAIALMALIAIGWTILCRRLVDGQTGDLIGALQALLEIAALTGFLLF